MDALYRRTERWSDLIGVYRRRIELAARAGRSRGALRADGRGLRDAARPARGGDRRVPRGPRLDDTSLVALTALDGLFTPPGHVGGAGGQPRGAARASRSTERGADPADAPARRPAGVEDELDRARRSTSTAQVLEREPTNAEALGALERLGQVAGARARRSPRSSSRSTASRATSRSSSGCTRCRCGAATIVTPPRRAAPPDRHALRGRGRRPQLGLRHLRAGAAPRIRRRQSTQEGLDRLARADRPLRRPGARLRDARGAADRHGARRAQLYTMSARVYEADLGDLDSAVRHYRTRARDRSRRNLHAAESLERHLPRRRSATSELSQILQQKADILDDLNEKKLGALPGRRASRRTCSSGTIRRSPSTARCSSSTPEDLRRDRRADQALPRPLALGGPPLGLREEGRSRPRSEGEEAHLLPDRRRLRARARRRRERDRHVPARPRDRSGRPPGARAARRPLPDGAELARAAQRAPARGRSSRADPAEGISYQYRIAELYEKHLDDTSRAIELYRDLLQQMPDHGPTLARARGDQGGQPGSRSAPRSCSSRSTTRPASGRSSSASSRCRSRRPTIRTRRWSCSTASRGSTRRCSSDHAGRVRHVRARGARATSPTRTRSRTSSGSRWRSTAGRDVAALYDHGARTSSARSPQRFVELASGSRRSSRRSSRTSTTPSRATGACSRSTPENQSAIALARSALHR